MKLKIVSDGTPMGTRVEDEKGNRLDGVTSVEWDAGIDRLATCTLELTGVPVEVTSEDIHISHVEFMALAQEAQLSEEQAERLVDALSALKVNQFNQVFNLLERARMRRLVRAVTTPYHKEFDDNQG